jgi:hypothetical protein
MMEAVRTSETSVDNHFTRQYIPEDNSEHHIFVMLSQRGNNLLPTDVPVLDTVFSGPVTRHSASFSLP